MKKNYMLNLATKTLTITKAFEDAVSNGCGKEYELYTRLMRDIPDLIVIRKTHATPRSYTNHQGEKFNCNQFKNLSYKNMERFINDLPNSNALLAAYNFLKNCGSLPLTSRYTAVRRWFMLQFPEFRRNPLFYFNHEVEVIDYTHILEEVSRQVKKKTA